MAQWRQHSFHQKFVEPIIVEANLIMHYGALIWERFLIRYTCKKLPAYLALWNLRSGREAGCHRGMERPPSTIGGGSANAKINIDLEGSESGKLAAVDP